MRRRFNRIAALSAYILLSGALAANADPVIPITNSNDGTTAGTLTVTRTNNVSPGWDEIDLNFASWTVTYGPSATVIRVIEGTWSGVGGNLGVSALGGTDWVARTTNANNNTLLESFVNFDNADSDNGLSSFARGPGSAGSYAWFTSTNEGNEGGWYATNGGTYLGGVNGVFWTAFGAANETTLLGKMYVTTGGDVAFQGNVIIWGGGMPTTRDPFFVPIEFSTAVPEPPAAVLVAAGLISAVTCVRRKRR